MTVGALRTLLVIAAFDKGKGLTFDEVAHETGLKYVQAFQHIELLSTGRPKQPGLGLVSRHDAMEGRLTLSALSELGKETLRLFARSASDALSFEPVAEEIQISVLPAISKVVEILPGISLGTLVTFLQVGLMQNEIGIEGVGAKEIKEKMNIANVSRHLAILSDGLKKRHAKERGEKRPGYEVIEMIVSKEDSRVKLPELTRKGHEVFFEIAKAAAGRELTPPKRPKPELLEKLDSPDEIIDLDDSDFDDLIK